MKQSNKCTLGGSCIVSMLTCASLGMLALSVSANAAELRNSVRAGLAFSDNIGRANSNEQSETIVVIDGVVNLSHVTRATDLSLTGNIGLRHYVDTDFDTNVIGNLLAAARFQLVPRTVTWVFEDRFGTLTQNPFQSESPDNIENINNFSTGPDFHFEIGNVTALDLGARYRENNFEKSPLDSTVIGGNIGLVRALSPKRNVSLNYTADEIDYDNDLAARDFDRESAFVALASEMSRGQVSIRLGTNKVKLADESFSGLFTGIQLSRQLTARSTFNASFDQQYSDAGNIFRQFQDPGRQTSTDASEVVGAGEPFENRRIRVGWDMVRERSNWNLSFDYNQEDYVSESALDRDRFGFQAGVSRRIGAGWNAKAGVRYQQGQFSSADRDDDDTYLNLGISRRLTRTLDLSIDYVRADRSSTIDAAEYTENRVSVTVGYSRDRG